MTHMIRTYWYVPVAALILMVGVFITNIGPHVFTTAIEETNCIQTVDGNMRNVWHVPESIYDKAGEDSERAINLMKGAGKTPETIPCYEGVNNGA